MGEEQSFLDCVGGDKG